MKKENNKPPVDNSMREGMLAAIYHVREIRAKEKKNEATEQELAELRALRDDGPHTGKLEGG